MLNYCRDIEGETRNICKNDTPVDATIDPKSIVLEAPYLATNSGPRGMVMHCAMSMMGMIIVASDTVPKRSSPSKNFKY